MMNKKGRKWALSCVAISATVLSGMSTSVGVFADAVSNNNTEKLQAFNESLSQIESNFGISRAENSKVQPAGKIIEDYPNYAQKELGKASYFHIFAKEAMLDAHTSGNLAVGILNGEANFGNSVEKEYLDKDISYIEKLNYISKSSFVDRNNSEKNKAIFGSENTIDLTKDGPEVNKHCFGHLRNNQVYQDKGTNKYIDFDSYFKVLEDKSVGISNRAGQIDVSANDFKDVNSYIINLKEYTPNDNNQIIINLDPKIIMAATPLKIKGLSEDISGTDIIINVDTNGVEMVNIGTQIELYYGDNTGSRPSHSTEFFDDNHLLWNFYDSKSSDRLYHGKIEIGDGRFLGSLLAPKAEVITRVNFDGNIVAENVFINGGESHQWNYQGDDPGTDTGTDPGDGEDPGDGGEDPGDGGDTDGDPDPTDPDGEKPITDGSSEGEDPDPTDPDGEKPITDGSSEGEDPDPDGENPIIDGGSDNGGGDSGNEVPITDGISESVKPGTGTTGTTTLPKTLSSGNSGLPSATNSYTSAGTSSGSLPKAGTTTGIVASIAGVVLLAFGAMLKVIKIKKND